MGFMKKFNVYFVFLVLAIGVFSVSAIGQNNPEVLNGDALKKVVPTSFYFAGQSAETQIRNAVAAKFGETRFVIAGLVDTSGYSTEIQGKYEGFLITDSPIKIGGKLLNTGAYGFGFAKDSIKIFDLSSKEILTAKIAEDTDLKRPRPLMMTSESKGIRLYKGKLFATIAVK